MMSILQLKTRGRRLAGNRYRDLLRWRNQVEAPFHAPYSRVYYVVDRANWSISWDGRYITSQVRRLTGLSCRTTTFPGGIRQQVVHFGYEGLYVRAGVKSLHPSNRVVFTWFHGSESDPSPETRHFIANVRDIAQHVDRIVTSSTIGKVRLVGWGVPETKISLVPLGIDLDRFRPPGAGEREAMRRRLGVPDNAVCIGSFHKDGVGWGEGLEPKLVKGPDVFLKVIKQLATRHRVFVVLTGPARGYVKGGLREMGVPYSHTFLKDYRDVAPYYHALDLYLVASRDEGGPKAVLECMATGVPIVSTRVGMAQDLIRPGENGYLAEIEDVDGLCVAADDLIGRPDLRRALADNGLATVTAYDWSAVAGIYYEQVYKPLLASQTSYA